LYELDYCRPNAISFVPVGGVTSGSMNIARALADIHRKTTAKWKIFSMAEVERQDSQGIDAIVFIDDFSGTGNSLKEWWQEVEPLVLPKRAVVLVGLLVMNYLAREQILKFAENAVYVQELDESDNAVSPRSKHFNKLERQTLMTYCRKTGATGKYLKGYGGCGLLVAFRHGCPNNSLPILCGILLTGNHFSDEGRSSSRTLTQYGCLFGLAGNNHEYSAW
jgi:hypothetical protein